MTEVQSAPRQDPSGIELQLDQPLGKFKPLSAEAEAKGEAFVQAMLDEGHDFRSMKAGFMRCTVLGCVKQAHGVLAEAARNIKTSRDTFVVLVRNLRMKKDIDRIRAAVAQSNGVQR